MKKKMLTSSLFLAVALATGPAVAQNHSAQAALGAGLGGALGAYIGSEVDGRGGAIVGGALGAAAGAAIATPRYYEHSRVVVREVYRPRPRAHYRPGWDHYHDHPERSFCPPGQAKKGRC